MYPQLPSDPFFFPAMMDELAHLRNCMLQARRHMIAERTMQHSSTRQQVALRGGQFLLRCSQWLLRYSEGLTGSHPR